MGTPMDRRHFLWRVGALTASVGSVALLGAAAGCTRSPAKVPKAAPTTVPVTTGPPDWAELARMLSGSVIVPSSYGGAMQLGGHRPRPPSSIATCWPGSR